MIATTLIAMLSLLIAADFALTATAVGRMGATELNPLFALCGSLPAFLTLKAAASVACVIALLCLRRAFPSATKITAGVLCGLYGVVVLVGIMGIAGIATAEPQPVDDGWHRSDEAPTPTPTAPPPEEMPAPTAAPPETATEPEAAAGTAWLLYGAVGACGMFALAAFWHWLRGDAR